MLLRSIISDNIILNINYSIRQTTIYAFFDILNSYFWPNRYDKMIPLIFQNRTWAILGRKMVYVSIGFYITYRLIVIYSDKVLFSIFINVKCLLCQM